MPSVWIIYPFETAKLSPRRISSAAPLKTKREEMRKKESGKREEKRKTEEDGQAERVGKGRRGDVKKVGF